MTIKRFCLKFESYESITKHFQIQRISKSKPIDPGL